METGQEGEMTESRGHGTNFHLDSPHFSPCSPHGTSHLKALPASVLVLGSTVLRDALGS